MVGPPAGAPLRRTRQEQDELDELEAFLADRDDRSWLQAKARAVLPPRRLGYG